MHQVSHPPPVVERVGGVALARPGGRACAPLGGAQRLKRLLPVAAEHRRKLVVPVGVECLERAGYRGVGASAPLTELRAVLDVVGEELRLDMSRLLVYVDTSEVREGALEELKLAIGELADFVEKNEQPDDRHARPSGFRFA
jgi:hypothetical protein